MDLDRLKDVVISEAREEAENLFKRTKEEVENLELPPWLVRTNKK